MGAICEIATSAPGYTSVLPKNKAPLAMTLKLNGYSTAQFGKCHEVPVWQTSPLGPFDQWPTGGGGFEYFYGFIGGEANQWYPTIYEGTTPVEPEKTPEEGYHLMEDMTDKAIDWMGQQKALASDKPFFIYLHPRVAHPACTAGGRRRGTSLGLGTTGGSISSRSCAGRWRSTLAFWSTPTTTSA